MPPCPEKRKLLKTRRELSWCLLDGKQEKIPSYVCSFNLIHFNSCLLRWLKSNLISKFSFQFLLRSKNSLNSKRRDLHIKEARARVEKLCFGFLALCSRIFLTLKILLSPCLMHFNGIIIFEWIFMILNHSVGLKEKPEFILYNNFKDSLWTDLKRKNCIYKSFNRMEILCGNMLNGTWDGKVFLPGIKRLQE